ncbi:MAG: ROK family transcriptional regulator [Clostridiales bacterium]|nr:ROK family transcriptional regulator [Clostridiales bacterium]
MESTGIFDLKRRNRSNVYSYIYSNKHCAKQEIAAALNLSLPTVSQNLKDLFESNFIINGGLYESTGGRKAAILQCKADAKVAVGVEILKDYSYVTLCDLYGNALKSDSLRLTYKNDETYFSAVGYWIKAFIKEVDYASDQILGIAIATQGIVSNDLQTVIYGRILNNQGVNTQHFSKYIGQPCVLLHDSKAAAFAESFYHPQLKDTCYIFLNRNLGSATIMNHEVFSGNHARGQILEHMSLFPGGRQCYCGKTGCTECYCSANSLMETAGEDLDSFFMNLRVGSDTRISIWNEYLQFLSLAIYNVLMVQDLDIIIGGKIRPFMNEEDLKKLLRFVRARSDFEIPDSAIILEQCLDHPAARGAALHYIKQFLAEF